MFKFRDLHKVFSVRSHLQALVLQEMLAQAGIPVELVKSRQEARIDLMTETRFAFDAQNILNSISLSI